MALRRATTTYYRHFGLGGREVSRVTAVWSQRNRTVACDEAGRILRGVRRGRRTAQRTLDHLTWNVDCLSGIRAIPPASGDRSGRFWGPGTPSAGRIGCSIFAWRGPGEFRRARELLFPLCSSFHRSLRSFGGRLRESGGVLEASRGLLGASWEPLEAVWGRPGASWGPLEGLLGVSWGPIGDLGAILGRRASKWRLGFRSWAQFWAL